MKRRFGKNLIGFMAGALALNLSCPVLASHGPLSSTQRDAWVNDDLSDLVNSGLVQDPGKPVQELTNFEAVRMTAQASMVVAQADPLPPPELPPAPGVPSSPDASGVPGLPPPAEAPGLPAPTTSPEPGAPPTGMSSAQASKGLQELLEEFKTELGTLGIDADKLEDQLNTTEARNEVFKALQEQYLKRTGTDVKGFTRGYMNNYRGFGNDPLYGPMDYNADIFMEMDLKSVPVPDLLFDGRIRFWRSIGMYYQDPIQPEYQLRWISLLNFNEAANLTAGDFYKSYTPLTLWDSDAPVYTLIEPSSFKRNRLDTAELVYMDQAPNWHLRGFQAVSSKEWAKDAFSGFSLQAMGGSAKEASPFTFGSFYAGTQDSLSFLSDNLKITGTGLMLWQDQNTANVPYQPGNPTTYAKQYQVASLSARLSAPLGDKADLRFEAENAGSQYQDDANNPQSVFKDWAFLGRASLNVEGFHLSAKYIDNGPYFYSPGAQTNAFSAFPFASPGYVTGTYYGADDALPGWLNGFVFQDVNRPSFAAYDRLAENILPYGDATPNRQGLILGFSAELGKGKWLKPQVSYVMPGFQEIQSNLIASDTGSAPADGNANARSFSGYEGALTLDMAKAMGIKFSTYTVQLDYKHQETDLNDAASDSLKVDTLILAADFNIPAPIIKPVVWSVALEQVSSSGTEDTLTGIGNPPTLAAYNFYLANPAYNDLVNYINTAQGVTYTSYQPTPLDLTKTTLAFGLKYPLSDLINFRADYFLTNYNWSNPPAALAGYSRYENIWRFTYEAHF